MEAKRNKNNSPNTLRTETYQTILSELSHSAKQRHKWMEHFGKYRNVRLTCRHFGISPDTFYLWRKRFIPNNLKTLEDNFKTRKPHKMRTSKHKKNQLETIKKLKDVDPRLGKTRIAKILKETGYKISSSTVGRMLKDTRIDIVAERNVN